MSDKVYTVNEIMALRFMTALDEVGLGDYFDIDTRVYKTHTMIFVTKKSGEVVKASMNPAAISNFIQGLGEGFAFGKEWAY